jgi:esterase FrsA
MAKTVVTNLTSYDRDEWASAFSAVAARYEAAGQQAEKHGAEDEAKANYLRAYSFYRMARFPTTNSDGKRVAYCKSQELFLNAARYFEVPVERVELPFLGREGEGDRVIAYLRVPKSAEPLPLLLVSGGIDTFKEDSQEEDVLGPGIATLSIGIPGVGDSPLVGSADAERLFDAIFDWVGTRHEIDLTRVGYWGSSTGGYWAVKVAHTHRKRLAAVVSQGGCTHFAFEADWIEKAQWGDYPFELAETLAFAFGRSTLDEWVE